MKHSFKFVLEPHFALSFLTMFFLQMHLIEPPAQLSCSVPNMQLF